MSKRPEQTHDFRQRERRAYQYIEGLLDEAGCPKHEWAHFSQYALNALGTEWYFKRRLGGAYDTLEITLQTGPSLFFERAGGVVVNGVEHTWETAVVEIARRYAEYNAKIAELRAEFNRGNTP